MTTRAATRERENELELALADDVAFRRWYDRTLPRVYSYLLGRCGDQSLSEELTQQTFIAAIDRRARFDGRADSVTWLCAIARHKLADHFRRAERDERRDHRVAVRQIEMGSAGDPSAAAEDRERVAAALASLPATQRAVLVFVVLDGLSVGEAGALIGKRAGAAQSLLNRARDGFRRAYGQGFGDD